MEFKKCFVCIFNLWSAENDLEIPLRRKPIFLYHNISFLVFFLEFKEIEMSTLFHGAILGNNVNWDFAFILTLNFAHSSPNLLRI